MDALSSPDVPKARHPGIVAGAAALLFGMRWLMRRRDLWPLAAVPALLMLVLGTGGGGAGLYLGYHYMHQLLALHTGLDAAGVLIVILAVLAALLAAALGVVLGAALAVPLSGPALERIADAMRLQLGLPESPAQGLHGLAHGLAATALTFAAGLVGVGTLTLIGVLVPVATVVTLPLKAVLLSWLLCFDLGDPAFSLMGMSLRERLGWLRRHLGAALGFGGLSGVLLGVPVLGLLVLPAAVAGVTYLIAAERTGRTLPLPEPVTTSSAPRTSGLS